MTALSSYQGLEAIYRAIPGIRTILLGEPTGDMELPALFTGYQDFTRPLRNIPPARNVTGMQHTFISRLVIQWVDFPAAEMQLLTLLDAIPDAIDADPRLGNRLTSGMAWCEAGVSGFIEIGGVKYRVVDYQITVLEKRTGL